MMAWPTPTAGFLHVSGCLHDPGQLYQGLLAEGVYQPRSDTSLRTLILYISVYTSDIHVPAKEKTEKL